MKTSLKTTVITISIIIVILIALIITLYFVGRKQGKKAATEGNRGKLPQETDWGQTLTEVENSDIKRLTLAIYDDLKGWNILGHNRLVYKEYLLADDRTFVGVANYFADQYGENLAKWIDDDKFTFSEITDAILARLAKHGITA